MCVNLNSYASNTRVHRHSQTVLLDISWILQEQIWRVITWSRCGSGKTGLSWVTGDEADCLFRPIFITLLVTYLLENIKSGLLHLTLICCFSALCLSSTQSLSDPHLDEILSSLFSVNFFFLNFKTQNSFHFLSLVPRINTSCYKFKCIF